MWQRVSNRYRETRIMATPIAIYVIRTFAVIEMVFALAIVAGGEPKWAQENFVVIAQMTWAPYSFAIWLFLASLAVLVGSVSATRWNGSSTLKTVGFLVIIAWWVTYAVCVAGATTMENEVPYSATVGALLPAGLSVWLVRIDERNPLDEHVAFGDAQAEADGAPALPQNQEILQTTLRVLDESARSVPLLPAGSERPERLPGADPAAEPDADRVRSPADPGEPGERSVER